MRRPKFKKTFEFLEKALVEAKKLAEAFEHVEENEELRSPECSDAFSLERDIRQLIEDYSHHKP